MIRVAFILLVFFANYAFCKKLIVNQCIKNNGTIAYQEDPCEENLSLSKKYKRLKSINKIIKPINFTTQYYKSLNSKVIDNLATKIISNTVKGFKISFEALKKWTNKNKVYDNKFLNVKFREKSANDKMSLLIDFIYTDGKTFSSKELIELLSLSSNRFVEGSKEGQINVFIMGNKITGAFASFTDSNKVSEYEILTKGLVYNKGWLVQFSLYSNNFQSNSYQFVLQSLFKNMKIQKI